MEKTKLILLLSISLFMFACSDKTTKSPSILSKGMIEGIISTDQPADLTKARIFIIPQNPQLNSLEIFSDSTGYFKQGGLLNGNYHLSVHLYSFSEHHQSFIVKGDTINFDIVLCKMPFLFRLLGISCEYFYYVDEYARLWCGDMGKRFVLVESNYKGQIEKAISTIVDTIGLDGTTTIGRFINSKGEIYYAKCPFSIGKDILEIIDFGASCSDDSTDLRILRSGLKITIKTEFNGFYFDAENPDSNDLIPFSVFCLDTTTVKEK